MAGLKLKSLSPEARQLLAAVEAACAANPHSAEFIRESIANNAHRLIDDYRSHDGCMEFRPWWLLDTARAFVRAFRETKQEKK